MYQVSNGLFGRNNLKYYTTENQTVRKHPSDVPLTLRQMHGLLMSLHSLFRGYSFIPLCKLILNYFWVWFYFQWMNRSLSSGLNRTWTWSWLHRVWRIRILLSDCGVCLAPRDSRGAWRNCTQVRFCPKVLAVKAANCTQTAGPPNPTQHELCYNPDKGLVLNMVRIFSFIFSFFFYLCKFKLNDTDVSSVVRKFCDSALQGKNRTCW